MAFAETAQLAVRIDLEGNAAKGIAGLNRQVKGLQSATGRMGKGFGQIGTGLARAGLLVGGAAVTGLAAAGKAAIDWEDAFQGVVKTVDASDADLKRLSGNLRDLSTKMPTTAVELAAIGEAAGAMGVGFDAATGKTNVDTIAAFTEQVAILAATTDVAAEDAATALGQLTNVLGLGADEFDNFAAALVDLGNKGASTESQILEITRRAGGAAKNIDLSAEATLGWASAAANLGLQQELAGTSLQRFFLQSQALVNDPGGLKAMAKVAGTTGKKFEKAFRKDASGALESFLKGLGELPKDERLKSIQSLFGKGTGLTRLLLGLSESLDKNLTPSLDTSAQAWEDATAAQEEFAKRNATVKSAIARLKNGLIDAAVTLGEGFAPAIGRAADKLAEFLRQDGNRSQLKKLGEDIGKAIDGIDWQKVLDGAKEFVGVMKTAMDWALRLLEAINKLPTEIKAAGAGFLALNKLSGGLIGAGVGNVVGGLAEAATRGLASRTPGVGRLFAQPVFVTNFPPGFGGGAGGVAGAAGKGGSILGRALSIGAIVASVASVIQAQQEISGASSAQAAEIRAGLDSSIAGKSMPELERALAGVQQGITDITSNPLLTLVQGDALTTLKGMESQLKGAITDRGGKNRSGGPDDRGGRTAGGSGKAADGEIKKTTAAVQALRRKNELLIAGIKHVREAQTETRKTTAAKLSDLKAGVGKTTLAAAETRRAASTGLSNVRAATASGSSAIVSAIYANRPVTRVNVNVSATTVKKTVTVTELYGSSGGSRNTKHATGTGPLI